ncbi:MAG: dTDP-glucose 4,6-dehydratase [Elusimicrobia bacterium]|nr:dTDP-glucose 4,6-dehydratase [Elusimicrobiota bacterium]MBU2614575.1 dTDP-glucose 4,6-dehydratase [Elusimicrobiota bacterium]
MKLLVTGGAGFIGSNFIRHIINKYPKYKIINLDKLTYAGNLDNLKDIEKNPNYKFVKADICDAPVIDKLLQNEKIDCIVNFAAETHVDRSIHEPVSFLQTDVFGTFTLLEASKKYAIERYIQISTDEVYGSTDQGSFTEQSTISPNSPYSASKSSGDLMVRAYVKTYNFPGIITRSSNNFGPFQYPEKIIPLFVTNAIEDQKLPLYGDGKNVRDWLYVIDNCEAIDIVLHKGKSGEIYNIGGGKEMQNIEITKMVLNLMNKPESLIKPVADRAGHDRRYSIDCSKIKSELGWKPKYNFETALEETVNWYVKNRKWWEQIKKKQKDFKEFYKKNYKL